MYEDTGNTVGLRISEPFGRKLVDLAGLRRGNLVLDVGTGLGPVFFPALDKVGSEGVVVGVDTSNEMVKGTHTLIKKSAYPNATIVKSDARILGFRDHTFDVVLSGFSYIYSSLEEVMRVLKDGGQFGLSTWTTLGDMDFMAMFVQKCVPISSGDVYYRDTSEKLRTLLHNERFKDIRVMSEIQEFVFKDEKQWWHEMLNSGWQPYLASIESLGVDLEEFKQKIFKELQGYRRSDGIPFTMSALFAFATK